MRRGFGDKRGQGGVWGRNQGLLLLGNIWS